EPGKIEKQIDELAGKVKDNTYETMSPAEKVEAIKKVIFDDAEFKCDVAAASDVLSGTNILDDSLLPRVLKRKEGVCLGLATLFMVVAERAHIPVHGIHAPNHIYCRYDDGKTKINIECT